MSFCAGDLGRLHAQASAVRPPEPAGRLAALCAGPSRVAAESRAHLEANVAAALMLESPQEYRRWLLTYVRFLAGARCTTGAAKLCSWPTETGPEAELPGVQMQQSRTGCERSVLSCWGRRAFRLTRMRQASAHGRQPCWGWARGSCCRRYCARSPGIAPTSALSVRWQTCLPVTAWASLCNIVPADMSTCPPQRTAHTPCPGNSS